jgi:hypothetical protein
VPHHMARPTIRASSSTATQVHSGRIRPASDSARIASSVMPSTLGRGHRDHGIDLCWAGPMYAHRSILGAMNWS